MNVTEPAVQALIAAIAGELRTRWACIGTGGNIGRLETGQA